MYDIPTYMAEYPPKKVPHPKGPPADRAPQPYQPRNHVSAAASAAVDSLCGFLGNRRELSYEVEREAAGDSDRAKPGKKS